MPMTIPSGFAEATFLFRLTDDPETMTTSLGVKHVDLTTAETLAEQLSIPWATWVEGTWGTDYQFIGVDVTLNEDGDLFTGEFRQVSTGIAATNHPVQNTALLVRKNTGVAGRSNRGRMYVPPGRLAEADVNNVGMIDSVDFDTISGEIDTLYDDLVALTGVEYLALLHAELAGGVPNPAAPVEITSFQLDQRVATQRRRLRG